MLASINGIEMAYDEQGAGDPVLLIHGFPLDRKMWKAQAEALAGAGYRVITPDLRGFGESTIQAADARVDGPAAMDLLADDVIGLLDHLEIERAIIGGMSMGGYVLLNLLTRYRERVTAPIFMVTRADADDETARAKRNSLIAEIEAGNPQAVADGFIQVLFAEGVAETHAGLVAETHRRMAETSSEGLLLGLRAIRDRIDSRDLLLQFDLPALVIGAAGDRAIPLQRADRLAGRLPNAHIDVLPGAGHMANLEQPEAFNRSLVDFLDSLS